MLRLSSTNRIFTAAFLPYLSAKAAHTLVGSSRRRCSLSAKVLARLVAQAWPPIENAARACSPSGFQTGANRRPDPKVQSRRSQGWVAVPPTPRSASPTDTLLVLEAQADAMR